MGKESETIGKRKDTKGLRRGCTVHVLQQMWGAWFVCVCVCEVGRGGDEHAICDDGQTKPIL